MSSAEALKAGLRGKVLRITHYYRDLLWQVLLGPYCSMNSAVICRPQQLSVVDSCTMASCGVL